jgi:hypothetical protein
MTEARERKIRKKRRLDRKGKEKKKKEGGHPYLTAAASP